MIGLVFDKTYEKPDGSKDVFIKGKNGRMVAAIRHVDEREAVIALDDFQMDKKKYKR